MIKEPTQAHRDYMRAQGITTPEQLVDEAIREDSPLHELFPFGEPELLQREALLARARRILRVRVVERVEHETLRVPMTVHVPFMVHDADKAKNERGYSHTSEVKDDPDKALRTLREELERVAKWLERTENLATYFGLERELDGLIQQVLGLARVVKQKGAA